jgi:hypothetical protein
MKVLTREYLPVPGSWSKHLQLELRQRGTGSYKKPKYKVYGKYVTMGIEENNMQSDGSVTSYCDQKTH